MKKVFLVILICLISCSKKDERVRYTYYDKAKKIVKSEIKEKLIVKEKDSLYIKLSEKMYYKNGNLKAIYKEQVSNKSRRGSVVVESIEYNDNKENDVSKIYHYSNLKEPQDSTSIFKNGILTSIEIPHYEGNLMDDKTIKSFDEKGKITRVTEETFTYTKDFEGGTESQKSHETKKYKNGIISEHYKLTFITGYNGETEEEELLEVKRIFNYKFDNKGKKIVTESNSNSLRALKLKFLDSRIEKVKMVYGNPDSSNVLAVASDGFSVFYDIYYNKIKIGSKVRPVVFFTVKDNRGNRIVEKIKTGNYGEKVYWNPYNSIRLSN